MVIRHYFIPRYVTLGHDFHYIFVCFNYKITLHYDNLCCFIWYKSVVYVTLSYVGCLKMWVLQSYIMVVLCLILLCILYSVVFIVC